ncbi:Ubiquinone/menaquinone biosynthesis C-methyltransferase UbiE [Desulfovibrionales bacterium]
MSKSVVPFLLPQDPQGRAVCGMFGRIAGWYDFLNHFLSLGLDRGWRRELVQVMAPGCTGYMLDLAAGTLDVSLRMLRVYPRLKVLAMDFSLPMLQRGQAKIPAGQHRRIQAVLADGRVLPLPAASINVVTIAFGIRNIQPRVVVLAEAFRVLAPGGLVGILEFGGGDRKVWSGLYNFYLHHIVPALGCIFSGDDNAYTYLVESIDSLPDAVNLVAELEATGFSEISYRPLLSGIVYLHVGHKPLICNIGRI